MTQLFDHGYALLIGAGECAYPKWSLPVTVKDMQALRAVLTDPDLCGYPGDDAHIRLLHDGGATRQAILEGLAWLAERTAADPDATAVVFYSGHGWLDKATGRYYLVSHDVEPFDLSASALPATAFTNALRQVQVKRLLVFIDSCHAAGMATAKEAAEFKLPGGFSQIALPKGLIDELKQGAGRAVFTSSLGEQRSWIRPDGSLSLYTYHLIEALKGAGNRSGDTTVRVSNLMNHLGKAVPASAQAIGKEQTPFFDTAAEDFPMALLLGGKGLSGAGFAPAQDAPTPQPAIQASGERSVPAGTISDSTVVTGDRNVLQQGKYNINIGNAQGVVIGDGAQVTQAFGGGQPASPGQSGTPGRQPPSGDARRRHLRQQLVELQGRHEMLSKRIAALDTDLGRALDSEHKLTLKERRQELVAEREQVAAEMARAELRLSAEYKKPINGTAIALQAFRAFEIGYLELLIYADPGNRFLRTTFVALCNLLGISVTDSETEFDRLPHTVQIIMGRIYAQYGISVASYLMISHNAIVMADELRSGNKPSLDSYMECVHQTIIPAELSQELDDLWREIPADIRGTNALLAWLNDVRSFITETQKRLLETKSESD